MIWFMRRLKRLLGVISSQRIVMYLLCFRHGGRLCYSDFHRSWVFLCAFFFQFHLSIAISTSLSIKILEPFSVVVGGEITHPQLIVLTMVSNGRCICELSLYISLCFRLLLPFFFQIWLRFHKISKWLNRVEVIGPINVWEFLDYFRMFWINTKIWRE